VALDSDNNDRFMAQENIPTLFQRINNLRSRIEKATDQARNVSQMVGVPQARVEHLTTSLPTGHDPENLIDRAGQQIDALATDVGDLLSVLGHIGIACDYVGGPEDALKPAKGSESSVGKTATLLGMGR
jgi:hypothetical protein